MEWSSGTSVLNKAKCAAATQAESGSRETVRLVIAPRSDGDARRRCELMRCYAAVDFSQAFQRLERESRSDG
jgi:hypothetical protein